MIVNVSNISTPTPPLNADGWADVNETDVIIEIVVCVILSLCIVFGNGLVCIAFFTDRKLQTTTNCFVVSLACSDLIVGLIVIPFYAYIKFNRVHYLNPLYRVWLALEIIGCSSSIMSLVVISLERCLSVKLPAIHRNLSRKYTYVGISFVWIYAIFVSGALMDVYTGGKMNVWIQIYKFIMAFFLPLFVIVVAYSVIFKVAILRTRRHSNQLSREIRIAVTISVVIGVFVCCWSPFFILYLAATVEGPSFTSKLNWKLAMAIAKWLQYINSVVNPIIYTYVNQDFRKSFLRLLRCFKNHQSRLESSLVSNRSRAGSHLESRTETTTLRGTTNV